MTEINRLLEVSPEGWLQRQLVRLYEQEALSVRWMVVEDMILDLVGQHELQLAVGALVDAVLIGHEVSQRLRRCFGQGPSSPH